VKAPAKSSPHTKRSPDQNDRSYRKLAGTLGALVGDALGVPVEFQGREVRDKDPVREMREFGTWNQPAGTWSDDGALLLCTLEGLAQGMSDQQIGQLYVPAPY
tara:strand:+ start:285 stop:593 length:309 start_codon:yes stop_codon:yes gene_type:complete